ncbi:proteasome component M29 [Coemansia sp. Benny D115]|nr:proteasome component M29 [Coemansia sp. Benny D115]
MRFALATTSDKIQKLIDTLLVPLLDKMDASGTAVKTKIIGLLGQINRKLKSNTDVTLPISALAASTFSKPPVGYSQGFRLMYVSMAVERASQEQLVEILPQIIESMHGRPASQQTALGAALLTVFSKVTKLTDSQLQNLGLVNGPAHKSQTLLRYATDIFMLNPVSSQQATDQTTVAPGLSLTAQQAITNEGKAVWVSDSKVLEAIKLSMLQVVASDLAFPSEMPNSIHELRLLALVCASCDPFFTQVASQGKDSLRRLHPVDMNSASFIDSVYAVFLGNGAEGNRRSPAAIPVKLKLVGYLNKSIRAPSVFPQCMQVVEQSLFGANSTNTLHRQGVLFLLWIVRTASQDKLENASGALLKQIQMLLHDESAPSSGVALNVEMVRGSAYVAWGTLAKRVPSMVSNNLDTLNTLFSAFSMESASVHLSIQEALLAMLPAYEPDLLTRQTRDNLLAVLKRQLESPIHQARYCALRYAISAFNFVNIDARWLCILGLADSKHEVQILAQSGLRLPLNNKTSERLTLDLPDLATAVSYLHNRVDEAVSQGSSQQLATKAKAGALNPMVYAGIIQFGRLLLLATGLKSTEKQGVSDEACVEDAAGIADLMTSSQQLSSERQRDAMSSALKTLSHESAGPGKSALSAWMDIVSVALTVPHITESATLSKSLVCLSELLSLGEPSASLEFFEKRDSLLAHLVSRDMVVQQLSAQALATVYATKLWSEGRPGSQVDISFWNDQTPLFISGLMDTIDAPENPRDIDRLQGAVVTLGRVVYGLYVAQTALNKSWAELGLEKLGDCLGKAQLTLLRKLESASKTSAFAHTAVQLFTSLGYLGMSAPLQVSRQDQHVDDSGEATMSVISNLAKLATTPKQQEAALNGLAHIVLGHPHLAVSMIETMQRLARSVTKKQLDLHFRIGRALAIAIGRFRCTLVNLNWMLPINPATIYNEQQLSANSGALDSLLDLVIDKMSVSTNLQERQASVVWVSSLVQLCPKMTQLLPWLPRLHAFVCGMLTDRDEFTRELATNALTLIYDMGDVLSREDMMVSLRSLFGGGGEKPADATGLAAERQAAGQSSPARQQEQQQSLEGRIVSAMYKSILVLATDMRNPALFYPLVQLASNSGSASNGGGGSGSAGQSDDRHGLAFGLAANIERACNAVQPYMQPIIPRLFRCTFDPNPHTQTAMKNIWSTLIRYRPSSQAPQTSAPQLPEAGVSSCNDQTLNSTGTGSNPDVGLLSTFWDVIIEECLSSMTRFEWQIRESGCNALASALSGANPDRVVPYLERIWLMSFRALDDIKATVREAGLKTCQALATSTVAWCTPQTPFNAKHDKQARAVMAIVVPFLVSKGVVSDAEDVSRFSLGLLLKLCRASGSYLSEYVPSIVDCLLETLSNKEPQMANYMSFHADNHNMTQEQLESLRLGAVKSSPIMQAIEQSLDHLTAESMAELVPRLQNIIRHGIGLATRAGCARTIAILCFKQGSLVEAHSGALVKAISGSLTENSPLQRQAWAAAIGYMAGMLTPGMLRNLIRHLEKTYFNKYESEVRGVAGQVLEQLARNCPEKLRQHGGEAGAMGFVHFGCFDADEQIAEAFQSAWQEYVLGLGTASLKDHLEELVCLPLKHLVDDRWRCRVQSAKTIVDVVRIVERAVKASKSNDGGELLRFSDDALATLAQMTLPELIRASQGAMWTGKEHVLECLTRVCSANAPLFSKKPADERDEQQQESAVLNEDTIQAVYDTLLKQLEQNTYSYQRAIVGHLNTLVAALKPKDIYGSASASLLNIIGQNVATGARADADGDEPMQQPQQLMLISAATRGLELVIPRSRVLSASEAGSLAAALCENAQMGVWNVRVSSLECLSAVIKHCASVQSDAGWASLRATNVGGVLTSVRSCAAEGKYVAVRSAALDALSALVGVLRQMRGEDVVEWSAEADSILELLLKDPAPSVADRAKELRQSRLSQ